MALLCYGLSASLGALLGGRAHLTTIFLTGGFSQNFISPGSWPVLDSMFLQNLFWQSWPWCPVASRIMPVEVVWLSRTGVGQWRLAGGGYISTQPSARVETLAPALLREENTPGAACGWGQMCTCSLAWRESFPVKWFFTSIPEAWEKTSSCARLEVP